MLANIKSIAQTPIKLMSYNLLKYPDGVLNIDRKNDLKYILDQVHPDILMVCEVQNDQGAEEILNYCLNSSSNNFSGANFEYNHSSLYHDLQQMLYFNNRKFELINQTYVETYIRDINHYTLRMLTTENDHVYIDIYVAHLKSSQGTTNENSRLHMVEDFVNDLNNISQDHYIIFAGDFNFYKSTESGYQKIISETNPFIMKDTYPCTNSNGCYWHNNISFTDIHSQSTHKNGSSSYVGGGLNDHFDFIMLSENMFDNSNLYYISNSFSSFGNNGNCFNKNINDSDCTGIYDMTLRNHLYRMSDHLPVTVLLETNLTLSDIKIASDFKIRINQSVPISNNISFSGDFDIIEEIYFYDLTGKSIIKKQNYKNNEIIDLQQLKKGIYFIKIIYKGKVKILKFAKKL